VGASARLAAPGQDDGSKSPEGEKDAPNSLLIFEVELISIKEKQ
jgi:FKBP-type peptidyl-prolyl cis-trans isomerase